MLPKAGHMGLGIKGGKSRFSPATVVKNLTLQQVLSHPKNTVSLNTLPRVDNSQWKVTEKAKSNRWFLAQRYFHVQHTNDLSPMICRMFPAMNVRLIFHGIC